jgi:hypothetical protein
VGVSVVAWWAGLVGMELSAVRNTALVRLRWERDTGVWAHHPIAQYSYSCHECGHRINKGERYYSLNTLMVVRLCGDCGDDRRIAPEERTTRLTLHWDDDVSRETILRHSRAWAAGLSEATDLLAEVRMQTFGTIQ